MPQFSHLHVHTQFSLLDGAADIGKLYKKAVSNNMPGLAITDHGNMFGVFQFVAEAYKHKNDDGSLKVKPIVGCEFYVVEDRTKKTFTKEDKDKRYHQLMLAKNAEGYKNLTKLCSLGYMEGMYGKYPRIDKQLILQYHKGLIATTCCLGASVPRTIIRDGEAAGEAEFKWWLDLFGEDYYIELQRHDIPEQNKVNELLVKWAAKYNVKVIASNDSHYVDQQDANAHDILLCINTGEKQSTPTLKEFSDDDALIKGKRFAFYNDQFYFKTPEEMSRVFSDLPEAIDNTNDIVGKVEVLNLKKDILLPNYVIPEGFLTQDDYLKHLAYEGARQRYGELLPEVTERLDFELHTVRTMGFAGYFLIVADFIKAGRDMGVFVGPGRGSAAGSAVAYCIGITNIDPIKYNLLFERFLNPDRKSMPDIDTDFDDEGRQKVIDYVVKKYGRNQVAQIVTYGSMAAKMSIKDVARVMDLPLTESNYLAKLVPEKPGISLDRLIHASIDGEKSLREKEGLSPDEMEGVKKLREVHKGNDLQGNVLREALILEGSVRGTGIHAAGIIIAPQDLTELIPVATTKDSDLLITQYEGKVIEDAGVIKMDFLGLKTLTIIRTALELIEEHHNVKIDIDKIPLDDVKTLELYTRGETNGTFQFESAGMQKYLKDLKPDQFEDLIAMNALYRPGPLEYIPNFIARKHGREAVSFDLVAMEDILKETYGITVYQEQVMLLSQKLAGFTKGDADTLRKAMGKKQKDVLDKMKSKFMEGCKANGHDPKVCEKIWTDWEAFASYAFNKSHSTCYAFVAFQTAYLKAHYPAEYMSAVLTHNLSNIDKITFFMEECRRMGIHVLGPDVNESSYNFSVNSQGQIRFGLGAVKGVGEGAVEAIINEREENGPYKNLLDLVSRTNLKNVNKRCMESLVMAGAFDFDKDSHRAQWFEKDIRDNQLTNLERALRYGSNLQDSKNSQQVSLFGEASEVDLPAPKFAPSQPWTNIEQLRNEKEVIGFYLSGHPLDVFKVELDCFCNIDVAQLAEPEKIRGKEITFAGIVTAANHRISRNGKPFGTMVLEDYSGSFELALFSDDYAKFKGFMEKEYFVFVKARVQPRFRDDQNLEVKVLNIRFLQDVGNEFSKSLTLNLDLNAINSSSVADLRKTLSSHPGKLPVKFAVKDKEQRVELASKKTKVGFSRQLFEELELKHGIQFKINT
ncbi:MAG TPA: DNA polymerase III subunit alpha [Bacteroidia bacterium]|nr:DNA polymerase III subunit alpha [Bacteroidia bacterium]